MGRPSKIEKMPATGCGNANRIVKRRVLRTTARFAWYLHRVFSKTQAKCSESKGFEIVDVIIFKREQRKPHFSGGGSNREANPAILAGVFAKNERIEALV